MPFGQAPRHGPADPVLYEFYGASETGVNTLMRPRSSSPSPARGQGGRRRRHEDLDDQNNECARHPRRSGSRPSRSSRYYNNPKGASARRGDYFWWATSPATRTATSSWSIARDMIISAASTSARPRSRTDPRPSQVWDVVVIEVPDEEWGESVHAIVQPRPGDDPSRRRSPGSCASTSPTTRSRGRSRSDASCARRGREDPQARAARAVLGGARKTSLMRRR